MVIYTQTDLDNAKAALVSGALTVRIGDREVTYRSQRDIIELINLISNYLDGVSTDNPGVVQAGFSRGAS